MSGIPDGKTILTMASGGFVFPLPEAISYQTAYGWEKLELGMEINAGLQLGRGNIKSGDAADALMAKGMELSGNIGAAASQAQKRSVNPKEAVLFKGVSHREYSLTFRIAAKSAAEVRARIGYVDKLQEAAAPSLESAEIFFTYPDTGTLTIFEGNRKIIKDRRIAISSIDTNFTPDGFYATWSDGTPLSFTLVLGIIELELPTKQNDRGMFSDIS